MSRVSSPTTGNQQQQNTVQVPRDKIAMRAYEKWCKRGRPPGTDKQDWAEAEMELRNEMSRNAGMQGQTRR